MLYPVELQYSKSHEWVKFAEDGSATVGLTDYAQNELGDLVFVNLPMPGDTFAAGDTFADVESVKAVSDGYSPVTGTVAEVNEELADAPQTINEAPYDAWLVRFDEITDQEDLLTAEEYEAFVKEEQAYQTNVRYVESDRNIPAHDKK